MSRLVNYVSRLTVSVHVLRLKVRLKPTLSFPTSEAITLTFGIPLGYLYLYAISDRCSAVYENWI